MSETKIRHHLTPPAEPAGSPDNEVHATRRGGARHEVSSRVSLKPKTGEALEGWALNISRGGVRVILEDKVTVGDEFDVTVSNGSDDAAPVSGRVVWVQEEPDGVVVGIEFR